MTNASNATTPPIDTKQMNDDLIGAVYMVVGRGTEGGGDSYHLSIAGITRGGKEPDWGNQKLIVGKSGYSIGAIQVDLGQRGTWPLGAVEKRALKEGETTYVDAIITAASDYARANHLPFTNDHQKLRSDLLSHGKDEVKEKKVINGLQFIDTDTRDSINKWAESSEGKQWIHQNIDLPQARNITQIALDTLNQYGKKDFKEEERFESLNLIAKMANQAPARVKRLEDVLKAGGDYSNLLQKTQEMKKSLSYLDADKAGEIGKKYEDAFAHKATVAKLHSAQQKVSAADYSPASQNSDAEVKYAVALAQGGGKFIVPHADKPKVETALDQLGYKGPKGEALKVDGKFDAHTRHAVRTFQKAHKLPETGEVDAKTLQTMEDAVQHRQEQLSAAPAKAQKQQEPVATSRLQSHPELLPLSQQFAAVLPHLSAEQQDQLAAYCGNRCARENIAVQDIGRLLLERNADGRDLVLAINQEESQFVAVNIERALNTSVEQSLNNLNQAQQEQSQSQQMQQQVQQQAQVMRM